MTPTKYIQEILGTVIGTVSGVVAAWDITQFADELHTIKLAAIGAATGFLVTMTLKWISRLVKKLFNAKIQ